METNEIIDAITWCKYFSTYYTIEEVMMEVPNLWSRRRAEVKTWYEKNYL